MRKVVKLDVSAQCRFDNPDDECLPLTRCVCGVDHPSWEVVLSVYADDPQIMPCCGRKLYFAQSITVFEVVAPEPAVVVLDEAGRRAVEFLNRNLPPWTFVGDEPIAVEFAQMLRLTEKGRDTDR